jgi:methylmalonyl-CoA/ethylmalonyl-CoA epimerase
MINLLISNEIQMIDSVPRRGAHGSLIAFVHPKSTGGVLVELTQK